MSAQSPLPSEGGRCSMTKRQRRHPFPHHSLVCFEEQLQKVEKVLVEGLHSGSNHFTTTPLGTSWRSHTETRCDPQLSAVRQSCLCYSANTWPLLAPESIPQPHNRHQHLAVFPPLWPLLKGEEFERVPFGQLGPLLRKFCH